MVEITNLELNFLCSYLTGNMMIGFIFQFPIHLFISRGRKMCKKYFYFINIT